MPMSLRHQQCLLCLIFIAGLGSVSAAPRLNVPAVASVTPPMNQTVKANAYAQLDYFFEKLARDGVGINVEGHAAFKSNDKFLPGKVAVGLGHVLLHTAPDDARLPTLLRDYRRIADMTVGMDNHTWGIHYYLLALHKLKNAGLLDQAISPETLALLRKQLDWRSFVTEPGYELINLPTNYFVVAFSVARLRTLLGWEDESASKILLEKTLAHYAAYSGKFGFSDETPGDGRFDRYSILLIAEICERFIETGLPVTPDLKALLRKAANVALNLGNTDGDGFSFGRSIGPYSETAIVEILSVAAYLDVLTPEEKSYAYTYSSQIAAKYFKFWFDPTMHSVDMWGKGRRTDTYRGKHRILGENFSLLHQLISTNALWNKAGMENQTPKSDLQAWLHKTQPNFSMTRFAQGEYDRALAIYRDQHRVISLLMVNGGPSQHAHSPYYPLPFSPDMVAGIADSGYAHPQLLPKFVLADGSALLGTAFIKNIQDRRDGGKYRVSYQQDALSRLGQNAPVKDERITLETEYTLQPGMITRTDRYSAKHPLDVAALTLEFASFSDQATVSRGVTTFKEGVVTAFEVSGLNACRSAQTLGNDLYKAPYGAMKTLVTCETAAFKMIAPVEIKWVIKYR